MNRVLRPALGALAAALLMSTAGCGSGSESASANESTISGDCVRPEKLTTLKVGAGVSLAYGPLLYVADELGYFEEENIAIDYQAMTNPTDALTLINSGDIDAAFGGVTAGFLNGIDRGLDLAVVASQGTYPEGAAKAAGFYIRSTAAGEIKSVADLKGKTIGLAGGAGDIGNAGGYFIAKILADGGLTLDDVEITNVPPTDTDTAFKSGSIDAAFLPSPYSTMVEQTGSGQQLDVGEALANETQGGLILGPRLDEKDPELGVAFVRALIRVSRDLLRPGYSSNPEIVDALAAHEIKPEIMKATPEYAFSEDLALNPETFESIQKVFLDYGHNVLSYDEAIPFDEIVDEKLRQAAVESLSKCGE